MKILLAPLSMYSEILQFFYCIFQHTCPSRALARPPPSTHGRIPLVSSISPGKPHHQVTSHHSRSLEVKVRVKRSCCLVVSRETRQWWADCLCISCSLLVNSATLCHGETTVVFYCYELWSYNASLIIVFYSISHPFAKYAEHVLYRWIVWMYWYFLLAPTAWWW